MRKQSIVSVLVCKSASIVVSIVVTHLDIESTHSTQMKKLLRDMVCGVGNVYVCIV